MDAKHTVCIDEIEGEYDLHHEYSMIQVQLLLHGFYDCGDDETQTINDGILVYSIQKFARVKTRILWCKSSEEYRQVEVDADLGRWSAKRQGRVDHEAPRARADPNPRYVGV